MTHSLGALALLALLAFGCDEGVRAPVCPVRDVGVAYRIESIRFGQEEETGPAGVVPGLNLDGRSSDWEDPGGCFLGDFRWPAGSRANVDNQLGPIAGGLSSKGFPSRLAFSATYIRAIERGDIQLTVTLEPDPDVCATMIFELDGVRHEVMPDGFDDRAVFGRFTAPVSV